MSKLVPIPESYLAPIENGGSIEKVYYDTLSMKNEKKVKKYAYVYLPYGYNEKKSYDILYCLHGGGGEIDVYFGQNSDGDIKRTLDNMIDKGDIAPVIAVSPTYYEEYNNQNLDEAVAEIKHFCEKELIEDLIPAVESKYATFAKTTDKEGIKESRNHRGYTGYSMGSLSTWYTFIYDLDYFRFFMPMSGDCWTDGISNAEIAADTLENVCIDNKCSIEDFNLFAVTGDRDIAYERMNNQIEAMKNKEHFVFKEENNESDYNSDFSVEPNAIHDYKYMPLYFYNGLKHFV